MSLAPEHSFDSETLQTFLITIEQGSFSAAAALLYKTPSAVSYRITNLENSLGVKLIERTTHSIKPTAAGRRLADKARFLLDLHQGIYEELTLIETGVEPVFKIVFNNLVYDYLAAAELLKHLHDKFPRTSFRLEKGVYMGVWDFLMHQRGNFAVGVPGFHPIDEAYETTPLGLIHWELVCAVSHPLLQGDEPKTKNDVIKYPVINVEDTSVQISKRSPWRLIGQDELLVPDLESKIQCHVSGLGIGFLPRPIAHRLKKQGLLEILTIPGVERQPSPMSLARPKYQNGVIGDYLESLFAAHDTLVRPFCCGLDQSNLRE